MLCTNSYSNIAVLPEVYLKLKELGLPAPSETAVQLMPLLQQQHF